MDHAIKDYLEKLLGLPIQSVQPVSGGDIAQSFLVQTPAELLFCKYLNRPEGFNMFQSEMDGLNAIRDTRTIQTPRVFECAAVEKGALLVMEFVETKRPDEAEMRIFGRQLAELHQNVGSGYGWKSDNFIGSLSQSNREHPEWAQFYIAERLVPQLEMARNRSLLQSGDIPSESRMLAVMEDLCPDVKPALLHGDLWGGNYLVATDGSPYLIDPAVYYGHSEVDIAMSRLFGGFSASFYAAYDELLPADSYSDDRIKLYQLYYLLVHLNLFGRSYYSGVKAIIKSYFY